MKPLGENSTLSHDLGVSSGESSTGENSARENSALPDDIAPAEPEFLLPDCDPAKVASLRAELRLDPLVAQTLARRGFAEPPDAALFLAGDRPRPAAEMPGALEAARAIARHVRAGTPIAVHGDYDVDGVCSTAIMTRSLAAHGARVTWHVPSRFEDGYGLSRTAIERLARDGAGLIVAVDCGITAVDEALFAAESGVELVICDHHTPGSELPRAAIAHPGVGETDYEPVCAATVVYKVCELLAVELGADPERLQADADYVALATVCDVIPLNGENRELTRRGLTVMRSSQKPGLRELMRAAAVDPLAVSAGDLGFKLGPRINAAGRMHSAEPAVELLLTDSERRAAELADQLCAANARRREVEQRVLFEAETQARHARDRFAIVVHGEGWHPGVLGIVAGRIAENFRRPCVALSVENGVATGSGRSGGVYDLLSGLRACSEHLISYGGHKAAAGLKLDAGDLPAFAREFAAHAAGALTIEDLRPRVRVDAVAEPAQLTLAAAEALQALAPFGAGNREPAILLPAVTVTRSRRMGETGRHLRLSIAGHGGRAGVVAFGWEKAVVDGPDAPTGNMAVKLRPNEFRGVVEAQSRLSQHVELPGLGDRPAPEEWIELFDRAYRCERPAPVVDAGERPAVLDRRGDSPLAVVCEVAPSADDWLTLADDPSSWLTALSAMRRIDDRLAAMRVASFAEAAHMDWRRNVILAEPPPAGPAALPGVRLAILAYGGAAPGEARQPQATAPEGRATRGRLSRAMVADVFRVVRDAGDPAFTALAPALRKACDSPVAAARAMRVLSELELVGVRNTAESVESIVIRGGQRTELDRSATFRSYSDVKDFTQLWLDPPTSRKTMLAA